MTTEAHDEHGAARPVGLGSTDRLGPFPWGYDIEAWLEVRDAEQIAADIRAYAAHEIAAERERCARKLQVTRADVSLAAGELSAQEWRTCAAVLRWMQSRIRGA